MGKHLFRVALAAALLAGLAACGGSGGDAPAASTSGVANIGSAGGVVAGEGGVEVVFPPKALANDVTVRITKDGTGAPPLPAVATAAGAVYQITPHGGALAVHAEVSIPVERTDVAPDEQMVLLTAQPGDSRWTVLSGASYGNGAMHAPVMHFSYFQVVTLAEPMPALTLTIANGASKYNNVGGPGVGRFSADYEFGPDSYVQFQSTVEAKLTYPAPSRPAIAQVFGPAAPQPCLPTSYAHNALNLRFLRNGLETVSPAISHRRLSAIAEAQYPRFESEVEYVTTLISGMFDGDPVPGIGALHLYGLNNPRRGAYQSAANSDDVWALPPAGNAVADDELTWRGGFYMEAQRHNGRIRIDASIATTCNLLIEAVPIAFNLNISPANRLLREYAGVVPLEPATSAALGDVATMYFQDDNPGATQSIAWEYSNDIVNWQKLPVPPQYIRDDGRDFLSHRYSIVIPNVQPARAGWYRAWSCANSAPPFCLSKGAVRLVVETEPPVVTQQPVSQIVRVGETATFAVRGPEQSLSDRIAGLAPPVEASIQWQRRPLVEAAFNSGSWTSIPGATGNYYTTPVTTANDTGTLYRALLTTAVGSTASSAALLTIVDELTAPQIVAQPASQNVVVGSTAVFVATVSGTPPFSYQWRRNGTNIAGANTPSLTLNSVTAANAGNYSLVVTNRAGTVTTEAATLVVTLGTPVDLPPQITAPPASLSVATGNAANFAVSVSGTGPYTYQWYRDGQAIAASGNGPSYAIAVATATSGGQYAVRVTNGVASILSTAATLTVTAGPISPVTAAPTIVTAPAGLAVAPGAGATFAVAVTGTAPFSYQWKRNGGNVDGASSAVLHIPSASGSDAGQYAVEVTNAAGTVSSAPVPLIVIGMPTITQQPNAQTVPEGGGATFSVVATGPSLLYQWTRNGGAIPGASAASYTTPALALADSGAVYGVVVYNGAGVAFSSPAVLTVTPAAATATSPFAYVARNDGTLMTYAIDAVTGALSSASNLDLGASLRAVTVDPSGKFVYATKNTGQIFAFTIDATTGALTAVTGSPYATGSFAIAVAVEPSGKFVYVANYDSNNVSIFAINATTGALTPVGAAVPAGSSPDSVTIHPSGKFAYVANSVSGDVSAYTINASSGALTAMTGSPFAAGTDPNSVAVESSGRFAYVANRGSNDVSIFAIDTTTGALTPVGARSAAGTSPQSVTVDPRGKFAYVANKGSANVSAYAIDAGTGSLTAVGAPMPAGVDPYSVSVDASGKFAYVANFGSANVSAYAINAISGALTALANSPFAAGSQPISIALKGAPR